MIHILILAQLKAEQPEVEDNYGDTFLNSCIYSAERKLKSRTDGKFMDCADYNYINVAGEDEAIINKDRDTTLPNYRTDTECSFMFDALLEMTKIFINVGNDNNENSNESFNGYGVSYSSSRNAKIELTDDIIDALTHARLIKDTISFNGAEGNDCPNNAGVLDQQQENASVQWVNDNFQRTSTADPKNFNKVLATDNNGKIIYADATGSPTDITSTTLNIGGSDYNRTIDLTATTQAQLTKANIIDNTGDGSKALMDDGTYKVVGGIQVQADYTQTDTTAVDYIKNKPTNLVHTDGDETIAGNKIFNGETTINDDLTVNNSNTTFNGEVAVNGDVMIKEGNMIDLPTDATDPTDAVNKRTLDSAISGITPTPTAITSTSLTVGGTDFAKTIELTQATKDSLAKADIITTTGDATTFLNGVGQYVEVSSGGGQPTTLTSTDTRTVITGSGTYDMTIDTSGIVIPTNLADNDLSNLTATGESHFATPTYVDTAVSSSITTSETYTDNAVSSAITTSETYTDTAIAGINIGVKTVNGSTGDVVLDGTNLDYNGQGKTTIAQAIDNVDSNTVHIDGDEGIAGTKTITGELTTKGDGKIKINFTPTDTNDATSKTYVDEAIANASVKVDELIGQFTPTQDYNGKNLLAWVQGWAGINLLDGNNYIIKFLYTVSTTDNWVSGGITDILICLADGSVYYNGIGGKEGNHNASSTMFLLCCDRNNQSRQNLSTVQDIISSSNGTCNYTNAYGNGSSGSTPITSLTAFVYKQTLGISRSIIEPTAQDVISVNDLTGAVVLTADNVMADNVAKISINTKIDSVNNSALHTSGNETITNIKTVGDGGNITTSGTGRIQPNFTPTADIDAVNLGYYNANNIWKEKLIYKNANVNINYKGLTLRQWLEGQNANNKVGKDVPAIPNHYKVVIKLGSTNSTPNEGRLFTYIIEEDPDNLPPLHNVINYCDVSFNANGNAGNIHFTTDSTAQTFIQTVNDTIFDANGYITISSGGSPATFPIAIYEISIYAINDTVYTLGGAN